MIQWKELKSYSKELLVLIILVLLFSTILTGLLNG